MYKMKQIILIPNVKKKLERQIKPFQIKSA